MISSARRAILDREHLGQAELLPMWVEKDRTFFFDIPNNEGNVT
jgi:hypothetical protein